MSYGRDPKGRQWGGRAVSAEPVKVRFARAPVEAVGLEKLQAAA